ncbi:uncharacterized protein [Drosophila tropicalis]|uniref:uncharacterized protein n=1 Tax=Drosophila tropicalis TaxID=46794 RepID=UPI0035AB71B5
MLRLLFLLLGIIRFLGCQADCNTCSASSGVACVSDTSFQFCNTSNLPFGSTLSCPAGYYCTANATICSTTSAFRSCNECKVCSSDMKFACLTSTTFALCMGTNNYLTYNITGTCAPNYVCNLDNPYICGSITTGSPASCPLDSDSQNLDPSDYTPAQYCQLLQQAGRFPYGIILSTTCKQ